MLAKYKVEVLQEKFTPFLTDHGSRIDKIAGSKASHIYFLIDRLS